MPELPEVQTVANTLYPHIHDNIFTGFQLLRQSSQHPLSLPFDLLYGSKINGVTRRGKLLLINLSAPNPEPMTLIAHLRMTGRLFTTRSKTEPGPHTRCIFKLKAGRTQKQLFFDDTRSFGKLLLATPQILANWPFWVNLGPEPLEIDAATFSERLKGARPLKTCLMDQAVIAGIGNIYADESLFQAGLSPLRKAGSLSPEEISRLLDSIQTILAASISQCGSSIKDYRDANGKEGSFQKTFRVYGRGGKKCKNCGAILHKIRLGGRATVFCENCQK